MTPTPTTHRRFQQLLTLAPLAAWQAHRPTRAHGARPAAGAPDAPVAKDQKPCGIAAEPREARHMVNLRMSDHMRFTPSRIDVRDGETLRLRVANRGQMLHEIVIGAPDERRAHAELMKKHPGMQHEEPYMAHVPAGQRGDITWTFNRAGDFEFACFIPSHFDAGMCGSIRVQPLA